MAGPSVLKITIPNHMWLSANQRLHWAEKARRTRFIRDLACVEARRQNIPAYANKVTVRAMIQYPTSAKADPPNTYPTIKAIIDGLTDARIWLDDNSEHVDGPDMRRDHMNSPQGTHIVTLAITENTKQ